MGRAGALGVVGSKRVYRIDVAGASDVTGVTLPPTPCPPASSPWPRRRPSRSSTYVDFEGGYARCPLGETTLCQIGGSGEFTEDLPEGHVLLPGVLHAYRASRSDLAGYVPPRGRRDHDCDDHGRDHGQRRP